jgi:uncharacterized protein YjiS (DUF1127 family)
MKQMQDFYEPRAGQVTPPTLIRPADPTTSGAASLRSAVHALTARLRRSIAGWRARRRARRRLESWLTMDPRLLADIGLQRADVDAAVYAGATLADRGGRQASAAADVVVEARPRTPLRLVARGELDAAA